MPTNVATTNTSLLAPPLSSRINHITRHLHTDLNTLIISLLPLSLPPQAPSPVLYVQGIAHILPIYESLEIAFRDLISKSNGWSEKPDRNEKEDQLVKALGGLWIPELERTEILRKDIHLLRERCKNTNWEDQDGAGRNTVDHSSALRSLTSRLSRSIAKNPHLLLSSTWLLYMALFSGGRHIRWWLLRAHPEFWEQPAPSLTPNAMPTRIASKPTRDEIQDMGLGFWTFAGEEDGEDIKCDFKQRFEDIEGLLTEDQKDEIAIESVVVIHMIHEVVKEAAEMITASGR